MFENYFRQKKSQRCLFFFNIFILYQKLKPSYVCNSWWFAIPLKQHWVIRLASESHELEFLHLGNMQEPATNYSPSTRTRLHPGRRSNAWQLQLRRIFTGNANWWLFHFNFHLYCLQNCPLRPLQPVITFNEFLTFGWAWSSAIRPSVETYLGGSLFYQLDSSTASLLSSLSFPSLLFPILSHYVS